MSGFALELRLAPAGSVPSPLRVVDLGGCESESTYASGPIRAYWVFPQGSRHWKVLETPDRFVLIEGQPDRYPFAEESLDTWLDGRWGSFRGFQIVPSRNEVRVFADPLGTRPVFWAATKDAIRVSDKQTTLALNGLCGDLDWPALMESLALGNLVHAESTMQGVSVLRPGENICFRPGHSPKHSRNVLPPARNLTVEEVHRDPAGTLLQSTRMAVEESWTDPDFSILLSGGLDSRFVLGLAGPGRKALTFNLFEKETELTRQIAACCSASLEVDAFPPDQWIHMTENGYLLLAGTHDVQFLSHLGLIGRWRKRGMPGLVNAYLFDTLLKSCFMFPYQKYPEHDTILFEWMGTRATTLRWTFGRSNARGVDCLHRLLSDDGKAVLRARMKSFAPQFPPVLENGFDRSLEILYWGNITRQVHYAVLLGWMEEQDVVSPIFHPELWAWARMSRPADRYRGAALRRAMMLWNHPVCGIIDYNTLAPISAGPGRTPIRRWPIVRNNPLFPLVRSLVWSVRGTGHDRPVRIPRLGVPFRGQRGMALLREGLGLLRGHPLFDGAAIDGTLHQFQGGDDTSIEVLIALMAAGQLDRLVREGASFDHRLVRSARAGAGAVSGSRS
jgi:hypothetical protein